MNNLVKTPLEIGGVSLVAGSRHWVASMLLVGLIFSAVLGCGKGDFSVAPVSGTVTLDGKALSGAGVVFQPIASGSKAVGPGSTGVTDAQGRFTLQVVGDKRPGAVVGEHRVTLGMQAATRADNDDTVKPAAQNPLPPSASDGSLKFTVPAGGTDKADFSLQKAAPAAPKPAARSGFDS